MNRDDTLWKAILEGIFDDFLHFFIPNANEIFDFERGFVFLDKELEQLFPPEADAFRNRNVDKLVQAFTRAGEEKWVLIHIEVQGKADKTFAERMYRYFARIFDKYHRSITAFAILADRSKSFNPTQYSQDFLGTSLVYRFNNYKVLAQNSSELATSNNPFAAVSLVVQLALQKKKLTEEDLFSLKLELAKALLLKSFDKQKIRQLLNFLRYYIRFEQEETIVKFDKALDILTNSRQTMGLEQFLLDRAERKGIEQGLEKGIEQGLEKGENRKSHAVVVNMIRQTAFSDAQITDLAEVPVAFVAQVRGELA